MFTSINKKGKNQVRVTNELSNMHMRIYTDKFKEVLGKHGVPAPHYAITSHMNLSIHQNGLISVFIYVWYPLKVLITNNFLFYSVIQF